MWEGETRPACMSVSIEATLLVDKVQCYTFQWQDLTLWNMIITFLLALSFFKQHSWVPPLISTYKT